MWVARPYASGGLSVSASDIETIPAMSKKLQLQSVGITATAKSEQNLLKEVENLKNTIKQLKSRKRYGLVWNSEKEPEKVVEFCKEKLPVLSEDSNKQIKTDDERPVNVLIEGD